MYYKEFYAELGKLLYAVADVDGVITANEKKKLHELVITELYPNEKHTDGFGTNAALYTEMEFDILDDEIADADTAFESFIDFIEEHQTAIDENLKNGCLLLADKLASFYYKKNKKENALIEKLKSKLNKINVRSKHHKNLSK